MSRPQGEVKDHKWSFSGETCNFLTQARSKVADGKVQIKWRCSDKIRQIVEEILVHIGSSISFRGVYIVSRCLLISCLISYWTEHYRNYLMNLVPLDLVQIFTLSCFPFFQGKISREITLIIGHFSSLILNHFISFLLKSSAKVLIGCFGLFMPCKCIYMVIGWESRPVSSYHTGAWGFVVTWM